MRIAFIFDALLYGGIERVGITYLKMLDRQGHKIDVFVLNPDDIEDIIKEIPSSCNIHKIKISQYLCPARYWYLAKRWWWGKFALPIVHSLSYLFLQIYGIRFRLYGKYDLAISMAGHFNDLSINAYNIIQSRKKICWLHGALYEYMVISPGFERLYMKIRNLLTLNDFFEKNCLFYNKFLKLNIMKLYNPCNILDRPINTDIVDGYKREYGDYLLMVSRLSPPKNHICLIKALEYIYDKYEKKYNLIIAGDGELMTKLRNYAAASKVGDSIFFVGNCSEPQNLYSGAKLFTFSSFSEGMPTVIIEAMNFGLPIVTTDTSVREILRNGADGLISDIDDYKAFGENIYRIMSDKDLWNYYSKKSLKRSLDFSPEVIEKQLNDFIERAW